VQDPPTRKIIKTQKGHTIQFEDKDDEEMVTIVEAKNGHMITMNKDGIKITESSGNVIEITKDAFTITAKVPFTIDASGQAVVIKGDTIDFNKG
jgi:hypothetical protein